MSEEFPEYSDEEFREEVLRAVKRVNELHHEALRNPTDTKVSQLLHSLRVLVDDVASPVTEHEGDDSENRFYKYREGLLGSGSSRKTFNQFFRNFAARRWAWPCVVEIHKGLAGMTFPRSKKNDSGLEIHLSSIDLGKALVGRETGYKKTAGKSFKDRTGADTFSGFVLTEIETIQSAVSKIGRFSKEERAQKGFKFPDWLRKAEALPPLSKESAPDWVEVILEGLCRGGVISLENHWELYPLLEESFKNHKIDKGEGAKFEFFAKKRIIQELRKLCA